MNAVQKTPPGVIFADAESPANAEHRKIVERFAQAYVDTGQWAAAYRRCYDCSGMNSNSVHNAARALSQYPGVKQRIDELMLEGAKRSVMTVERMLAHLVEMAQANPADVVRVSQHNCRHCHGADGEYQWFDQDEYAVACATELDASVREKRVPKMPTDAGGYGFTHHRSPNPECEGCKGRGCPTVHIADTRELPGPAAKLIKSVKQDRHGAITVELYDQQVVWEKIGRILGAFNDRLALTKPPEPIAVPDVPREQAAQAYLSLVSG